MLSFGLGRVHNIFAIVVHINCFLNFTFMAGTYIMDDFGINMLSPASRVDTLLRRLCKLGMYACPATF